jgi:glycine cleavage system H lipoate-binding protein
METTKKGKGQKMVVYDLTTDLCVWSKAGVAGTRMCHNAFDCTTCSFDHKVQRELAEAKSWHTNRMLDKKRYGDVPFEERKCRYMLTGQISQKYCVRSFNCASCEYDQMMEDTHLAAAIADPALQIVAGFALPENYYFHRGHTWTRVEYGGWLRIGLDDFALRLLGPLDRFELPDLGATVQQSEPGWGFSRGENQARVLSPVDGIVVSVNPKMKGAAAAANESPYGEGWLMLVKPTRLQPNLRNLLYGEEVAYWVEDETARLNSLASDTGEYRLAATGGRVLEDIVSRVPKLGWNRLVHDFLLSGRI